MTCRKQAVLKCCRREGSVPPVFVDIAGICTKRKQRQTEMENNAASWSMGPTGSGMLVSQVWVLSFCSLGIRPCLEGICLYTIEESQWLWNEYCCLHISRLSHTLSGLCCVFSVKSNRGVLLWLLFKWKHTGERTAEAQGTSLIETDGRDSGQKAKALQQREQSQMLKQNL